MAQAPWVVVADTRRWIRRLVRDDAEAPLRPAPLSGYAGDRRWSPVFCLPNDDAWSLAPLDRDGDMPAVQPTRRRLGLSMLNRTAITSAT